MSIFRRDLRNHSVGRLGRDCAIDHLQVEVPEVEVIVHCGRQQVGFLKPAELFPVGIAGNEAHHVVADGLQDEQMDLVQEMVRGFNITRGGGRRVYVVSGEREHCRFFIGRGLRPRGEYLDVPEAVEAEARRPGFNSAAGERIAEPLGRTGRFLEYRSIRIE